MVNIIAFEGLPGAGKTTVLDGLIRSDSLDNCIVLPELYLGKQDSFLGSKNYLDFEINKSKKVSDLKKKYNNILLDRTFLSTLAYYYAISKIHDRPDEYLDSFKYFEYLDNKYNLFRPTHLFYLDVSIPISLKRRKKFSEIEEFQNWFNLDFLKFFSEFYSQNINKFNMPKCISINTTDLSKEDVVEKIVSVLKK